MIPFSKKKLFLFAKSVGFGKKIPGISIWQFLLVNTKLFLLCTVMFSMMACYSPKEKLVVLTLGDSNGASKTGWVVQLQKLRPHDMILNYSVSGNTVGFDNLGQERLNTLKNINRYIDSALDSVEVINAVVILLGTNDAKAVFHDQQEEVPKNMSGLVSAIKKKFEEERKPEPEIVISSPPPYGPDSMLADKYLGGDNRVKLLTREYEKLTHSGVGYFVNQYAPLKKDFLKYSSDGVHLSEEGQIIIASKIDSVLTLIENKE